MMTDKDPQVFLSLEATGNSMTTFFLLLASIAAGSLGPGDHQRAISVDGRNRSYRVHIPRAYDRLRPTPVVLVLHGAAMNGQLMERFCRMNDKAEEAGFIAVYPDGTGAVGVLLTWNSGGLKGGSAEGKPDDVKYIARLLDDLAGVVNIDARRVYATGMSNGGMMCYRLAAELSDRIAAIAPVAGTMGIENATPERPLPVLHFHGTADTIVPFGGPDRRTARFLTIKSVEATIRTWVKINRCEEEPVVEVLDDKVDDGTTVTRKTYKPREGESEVILIEIDGGGHTWPGRDPPVRFIGKSTKDVSANDMIWEFFQRHPMPSAVETNCLRVPIGIDGAPEQGSQASWQIARDLGIRLKTFETQWIEPEPGAYIWARSSALEDPLLSELQELKRRDYVVCVSFTNVFMDQKHLPAYLQGKKLDDPYLLERWDVYLGEFLKRYGGFIDYLSLGLEVDNYFGQHPQEWKEYVAFFRRGASIVRKIRPELKVSVVFQWTGARRFWKDVADGCDFLAVTYYAPCSSLGKHPTAEALDPDHPHYFGRALDRMLELAGEKKILLREVGCPSHEAVDSSPEIQARFVQALLDWLREHEDSILGASWVGLRDWNYEHTKVALRGYLDESLLKHEPFLRFLTSLGLTHEDGREKPAYEVFRRQMASAPRPKEPAPATLPATGDVDPSIEGTWTVVSAEFAGVKVPALEGATVVFEKGRKTLTLPDGKVEPGRYEVMTERTPREMDATTDDRAGISRGIYAVEGRTLKMCLSQSGASRPASFTTESGGDVILLVLERSEQGR